MSKDFFHSPAVSPAEPPANNKGSSGEYNGEKASPFTSYPRTGGGIPEKTYDGGMPSTKADVVMPDQLPKHQ
jgi:hypothetical protein